MGIFECSNVRPNDGQVINPTKVVEQIVSEAVAEPTEQEQRREQLRQLLLQNRIRTDTEVPPEQYAIEVDGHGIFALRDIHAVKADAKAGKTTALKVCLAALLRGQMFRLKSLLSTPRILYFDTEQNRSDTKRILQDVAAMTGLGADVIDNQVALYSLRRCEREDLVEMLEVAIADAEPQVVLIDGIVEFVASFNDEAESKALIHRLLELCSRADCAIVCVLHTNKGVNDHNMRGHLGTMMAQKAATVLECKKENGSAVITVSCSEARHHEMPEWSIAFTDDGRIVDADQQRQLLLEQRKAEQQQRRQEAAEQEKQQRLDHCLRVVSEHGGAISRKELTEQLGQVLNRKRPTVSTYISQWLKEGVIVDVNGMIHDANNISFSS
jgi:RecA-family ATPase